MDLGVMAIKEYTILAKSSEELNNRMKFIILYTFFLGLGSNPFAGDSVGIL